MDTLALPGVRRLLRRIAPFDARWRIRAVRRRVADAQAGVQFATLKGDPATFGHCVCSYARPLLCYPGQEQRFAAKHHNVELALARVDGVVVAPEETFSFWRLVGRTTSSTGYAPAAALRDGVLVEDVGGAICLASTLLYNIGLLSAMAVDERWCHSVDSYGGARYFELGRDAAVEYAYRDLRLRNVLDVPLMLRASVEDDAVRAEAWSSDAVDLSVEIAVTPPEYRNGVLGVGTRRTVTRDGVVGADDLEVSAYRVAGND